MTVNNGSNDPNIQKRLNDFNEKLEILLGEEGRLSEEVENRGSELYKKFERERRALIERHNEEVSQLKVRIQQMSSQQHISNIDNYSITVKKAGPINPDNIYSDQLQFYRDKNKELEERIDSHITVNKELKDALESLMKGDND